MSEPHLHKHPLMPRIGQRLAERYELVEVIGEGGASVVYRALDHVVSGDVAVKVLSPRKSRDPEFAARFEREARLLRELTHPNTVKVSDVGKTDAGCLFLVQELLDGANLAEALRRDGPLAPARVVRIASQALRSLSEAHRLGIVHRDLKPQNIMLCQFPGETDYVKVLDFGMAKASTTDGISTAPGQVLFSPAYAAPEMFTGRRVSPSADIYCLGLLLLEMLTGEQAVTAPTVWGLIVRQSSDQPIEIPPQVAAHPIARVIRRAVDKDPDARYPDADAMLAELLAPENARGGPLRRSVRLQASPLPPEPVSPRRSARKTVALAAGLLIAALAAGLLVWSLVRPPPHRGVARVDRSPAAAEDTSTEVGQTAEETCRQGDYDVCMALALGAEPGPGGPLEPAVAHQYLDLACLQGRRARACRELARRLRAGDGVEADPERASHYATQACELGDTETCLRAGYDHLNGTGLALDRLRARLLLEAACEADQPAACAGLASIYANGWEVEPDLVRAAELYERACMADVYEACTRLGALRQQGRGVPEDLSAARELYQLACDHDDVTACANLATLYHRGLGTPADGPRARALYQRGCEGGVAPACAGLGSLYESGFGVEADLQRAAELFARACDANEATGCVNLARLVREGHLEGGEQAARAYLDRACQVGYRPACQPDSGE